MSSNLNKMKLAQEIKAAVLAECERLFPNDNSVYPVTDWLTLTRPTSMCYDLFFWAINDHCPSLLKVEISAIMDAEHSEWNVAYRLLGLDSREKDEEIDRLKEEIRQSFSRDQMWESYLLGWNSRRKSNSSDADKYWEEWIANGATKHNSKED